MDVNEVLKALILKFMSYPAVKLYWNCQLQLDIGQRPLMSPTHYIKELSLTTPERLDLLCKQQKKLEFWGCGSELTVVPAIIVFQNFELSKDYSVKISIRNISGRLQKVTILMEDSAEFSWSKTSSQITRMASGMVFKPTINFRPREDRDLFHRLIIITKESRFAIPILSIGRKGIMNFPDVIDFFKVPVKHAKARLVTAYNVGERVARFRLSTHGPFNVSPKGGVVEPKESFVTEVSFQSFTAYSSEGKLFIQYENGEEVTVLLKAEAVNCCAYITPPTITFDDTYIGLKSQASVEMVNGTSVVAQFKWHQYPSPDEAIIARAKLNHQHRHPHDHRFSSIKSDVPRVEHSVICINCDRDPSRSQDHSTRDPLFPVEDFLIEPVLGEIQPLSSKECILTFTPYETADYETLAYCDLTGQENRLALRISGKGIKPQLTFCFDKGSVPLSSTAKHTNTPQIVTDEVILSISIGGVPVGDMKIALFGKVVPKTVKNFVKICNEGVRGKSYLGSKFHRIMKDVVIQGGDIVSGDGTGSTSIYGMYFDDENFRIKHSGPGFVSMANSGPNTNGCQFFITAKVVPWLDGHHVAFGKVIEGLDVLSAIENVPVDENDSPLSSVTIVECGAISLPQPYTLDLDKIENQVEVEQSVEESVELSVEQSVEESVEQSS